MGFLFPTQTNQMFIGIGGFIHVIRLNLIRENYTLTFSGPEWQRSRMTNPRGIGWFSDNSTLACSTASRFPWKILNYLKESWAASFCSFSSDVTNFPLFYLQCTNQYIRANNHKDKSFSRNEWINTYEQINIKIKGLQWMNQYIRPNK